MRLQEELKAIQQRLIEAVKRKNIPEVMQLIADTGINLNTEACGFTACHYIGRFADDSLRVLLQANSELDFNIRRYARGAAEAGHRAYAEELRTQHGADIEEIILGASGAYKIFLQQIIDQSELTATAGSIGSLPSTNVNGLFSTVHNHASIADYSGTIVISLPENQELLDQFEEEVGESYRCPITHCVFTQPVIASDGETYEYSAIKKHIEARRTQGKQVTSPRTNQPLENHNLIPNNDKARTLRDKLDAFLSQKKKRKAEDQHSDADAPNAKKARLL